MVLGHKAVMRELFQTFSLTLGFAHKFNVAVLNGLKYNVADHPQTMIKTQLQKRTQRLNLK